MSESSGFPREFRLGPLRVTPGLVLIVMAVAGLWFVATRIGSAPAYCGSCHEMRPEYYTWRVSDHRNVGCAQCHRADATKGSLQNRAVAFREIYKHVTGKYLLPIEMAGPIPDDTCLRCHPAQWEHEASGDIIFPHVRHKTAGVPCISCHAGVAHGRLAERQQTIDSAFASWSDAKGRSNMVRPYRIIGMKECMDCHRSRDVSIACDTCHTKLIRPASHQAEQFETEHGKEALANLDTCDRCHSFTTSTVRVKAPNPVAEYARNNTFCTGCHAQRPAGHDADWIASHGDRAREIGVNGCQVCHEASPPRKAQGKAIAKTYCNQCHLQTHGKPGASHPVPVPPGPPEPACTRCHSVRACSKCHTNMAPKSR